MTNIRPIFPGAFTMGNLLFGFLAVLAAFDGEALQAAWFVLVAAFLDGLDGTVARISKASTKIGVELDSLADLMSFGLAPALIFYSFKLFEFGKWGFVIGFIYVMCGAFRLARFNVQVKSEEKRHFVGLPIPMAGSTLAAYTIFSYQIWGEMRSSELVITMLVVFSALMVSTVEYEGKPRGFRTFADRAKWLAIFVCSILVIVEPRLTLFPICAGYVLLGIGREIYRLFESGKVARLAQKEITFRSRIKDEWKPGDMKFKE
jgi:CDP-diacylglycerol--serine O-phosphatidyltransferase